MANFADLCLIYHHNSYFVGQSHGVDCVHLANLKVTDKSHAFKVGAESREAWVQCAFLSEAVGCIHNNHNVISHTIFKLLLKNGIRRRQIWAANGAIKS